jgi:hypothetical protein
MALHDGDSGEVVPDRDGSSPQAAIQVGSVAKEYDWLRRHLPGFRLVVQGLIEFEGKPLDVLTVRAESGDERRVFFDISSFFGCGRAGRSSAKPCPYCGAALRTEKAMQCFACGMDWRDPSNVIRRGSA